MSDNDNQEQRVINRAGDQFDVPIKYIARDQHPAGHVCPLAICIDHEVYDFDPTDIHVRYRGLHYHLAPDGNIR